jgi:predicted secreted hydrolase
MKSRLAALAMVLPLLASTPDYRRALPGYVFEFPRDYFNHPEFRTEWWYYTGNLRTAEGRRFGYELTFFRHAVDATKRRPTPNVWDVNDVWLAHFAVSDIDGGKFHHTQRMNRSGAGQAGADVSKGAVWNGNWRVEWSLDAGKRAKFSHKQLTAVATGFRIDLRFHSDKPPVVQGENGVSQKSAGAGRASHYVSLTRLVTDGIIEVQGQRYRVQGNSWMDHEFFTHSLEANQSGWDWFSLQLDDGSELMLYRLRRKDGSIEPFSSGTYVTPDGRSTHLTSKDYTVEPSRTTADMWTSPKTKGTYPLRWTLRVPSLGIEATTTTRLRQQEIVGRGSVTPNYWEGAVDLQGTRKGRRLTGSGYLEMTGYAGAVNMGE